MLQEDSFEGRLFWLCVVADSTVCRSHRKQMKLAKIILYNVLYILGDPGADSGDEGKSKRAEKYGAKTFLRAIFSRPFGLSLVPTICPWVSEDVFCTVTLL